VRRRFRTLAVTLPLTGILPLVVACGGDVAGTAPATSSSGGARAAGDLTAGDATPRGTTGAGVPAARSGDACDLVPRADLERALGARLGTPQTTDDGTVRACDYLVAPGSDVSLQLRVQLRSTAEEFASGRRSVSVGRVAQDVAGLGEQAYAADLPAGGRLVVARQGQRQLLVSTTGAAVTRDRAVAVARLGLPALLASPG